MSSDPTADDGGNRALASELKLASDLVNQRLEYVEAIEVLHRILSRAGLDRDQRIEAFRLLGVAHVARSERASAEAAFWELLRLDPEAELNPLLSPKIIKAFRRARQLMRDSAKLSDVDVAFRAGKLWFAGTLQDPTQRVAKLEFVYRLGDGAYQTVPVTVVESEFMLEVTPNADARAGPVEVRYYMVGRDTDGRAVARLATPQGPVTVIIHQLAMQPAPMVSPPEPWYGRAWIWIVSGVVVVAGAAAVGAVVATQGPSEPVGTLDPLRPQ